MMKIKLEGVVGKRFGREHNLNVRNPNEAIRALCHLIPGFREYLISAHEYGVFFQAVTDKNTNTGYQELDLGCGELTLVPVITGAMNFSWQNIGLILIGVLLVAISFGAFGIAYGGVTTLSYSLKMAAMSLGFALIFTGIAGLFAPGVPEDGKQEGSESNDAVASGGRPTATSGSAVPLLYGEYLCSNMPVISSYIDDDNDGHLLLLISEGAIEGLATGDSNTDLYFNGLQVASSSVKKIQITDGTQTTKQIDVVQSAGFHLPIGSSLGKSEEGDPNPQIVRSFTQENADNMKLRVLRGPCYCLKQKSKKEGGAPSSDYKDYNTDRDNGAPAEAEDYLAWNARVLDSDGTVLYDRTVQDKKLKAQKVYDFGNINIHGAPIPISIIVTRLDKNDIPEPWSYKGGSAMRSFSYVKGDIQVVSADVTWDERLIYPNSALIGMEFSAGEFTQMPAVQGLFRGLKVPTLNNNLTVSYAWSDNPAYVLLDLLTNPRYGCGRHSYTTVGPSSADVVHPGIRIEDIDLASFKVAADYCVAQKIKFNAYIARSADALDLIRSVAATFNASLIYAGAHASLVIDRRLTTAQQSEFRLYSNANVIQDTDESGEVTAPCFTYEGTGKKARTSAVEVSFVDPNQFYKEAKESLEDTTAIERYGYNQKRVRALGCTSRDQARRLGRYILASNTLNTETVSFRVGTEGAMLLPGDICLIADPLKVRFPLGGRVISATSTNVVLDREPAISPGSNFYLYTYGASGIAQKSKISSISGNSVQVQGFANTPTSMQMWLIVDEDNEQKHRRYRVQSVKEDGKGTFDVVGILYTDRKFDYVEDGDLDFGTATRTYPKNTNPSVSASKINFSIRNLEA